MSFAAKHFWNLVVFRCVLVLYIGDVFWTCILVPLRDRQEQVEALSLGKSSYIAVTLTKIWKKSLMEQNNFVLKSILRLT